MATQSTPLLAEFDEYAAPFIASGRYANAAEVLHAAMDALLRAEVDEQAYNEACVRAAEEGEASGIAEGDVIARLRAKHGFSAPVSR
jgi:Arc/MetJ-type ribon-helix-helix transcriptional regulator